MTVQSASHTEILTLPDEVWDKVVSYFQTKNLAMDATLSSKDLGQIMTTFPSETEEKRTSRTGYWTSVQILKGEALTIQIQVGQKDQTKLMAGLWRNPKLNEEKTKIVATQLQEVLRTNF